MGTKKLKDLKLSELRIMYPELKANSKDKMIKLIEASNEKINNEIKKENLVKVFEVDENPITEKEVVGLEEVNKEFSSVDVFNYVVNNHKSNKKILFVAKDSADADDLMIGLEYEVIPELEELGITVMFNRAMRYMHVNGTMFVRITCKRMKEHVHKLNKFTEVKEID